MRYLVFAILAAGLASLACGQPPPPSAVAITPIAPTAEPAPVPTATAVAPSPTSEPGPVGEQRPGAAERLQSGVDQANRAYSQAEFHLAADLYRQAQQPGQEAAESDPGLRRLRAFVVLRLGLSELLAHNEDLARQVLQEQGREEPDEVFRQMAFQLWDTYAMTGDPVAACARVSAFARERGVRVESGSGSAIGPDEICVVPGAGS